MITHWLSTVLAHGFLIKLIPSIQPSITSSQALLGCMPLLTDEITYVQVMVPAEPAIEGHLYKLMCNVTGRAEHVYWMKNGELVHEDNTTYLHMENRTLKFDPLERNDQGLYQCMASNPVGNMTSPKYQLLVNCEYHNSNGHINNYTYVMSPYYHLLLLQMDLMSQLFMAKLLLKMGKWPTSAAQLSLFLTAGIAGGLMKLR